MPTIATMVNNASQYKRDRRSMKPSFFILLGRRFSQIHSDAEFKLKNRPLKSHIDHLPFSLRPKIDSRFQI